jgi:hypothetical protein
MLSLPTNIPHHVIASPFPIRLFPNCKPQTSALLNNSPPQLSTLLANPASKDQSIYLAMEANVVRAYKATDPVNKQIKRQLLRRVLVIPRADGTEVRRACQRFPAGLLV